MKNAVFNDYAQYYDLFYKNKPYRLEAAYIHSLIKKHAPGAKSLLDVGCGTGRPAAALAGKGYLVDGVDMSGDMISLAKANNAGSGPLSFHHASAQSFRLKKKFDAAYSLFHVMSYQTTHDLFIKAVRNIHKHVNDGGIFIFDFWYGPAVLTDPPVIRNATFENERFIARRKATPFLDPNKNTVLVRYDVKAQDKVTQRSQDIVEKHHMRYWFLPEVEYLTAEAGFEFLKSYQWMTGRAPGLSSWNIVVVCRKVQRDKRCV